MGGEVFLNRHRQAFPETQSAEMASTWAQNNIARRTDNPLVIYRAQVISYDPIGGQLQNLEAKGAIASYNRFSPKQSYKINASWGPKNPARSIRAYVKSYLRDQMRGDYDLKVFYPMFNSAETEPALGEEVFVIFEDFKYFNGLWLSKVDFSDEDQTHQDGNKSTRDNESKRQDQRLAGKHGAAAPPPKDRTSQTSVDGSRGQPLQQLEWGTGSSH